MRFKSFIFLFSLLIIACQNDKKSELLKNSNQDFYLGTYTDSLSQGIYRFTIKQDGSLEKLGLVAKTENPSFLAKSKDGNYLLAVNEISNTDSVGTVESYLIKKDSLEFINKKSTGGAHPCFVSINNAGYVLTANYTGGNIGLLKIDSNGSLETLYNVQEHSGISTPENQIQSHAHSAYFLPDNNAIVSADLGTNELWFSKLDTFSQKLNLLEPARLKMEDGAGPRHLALHPNGKWIYVINELNSSITHVEKSAKELYLKKTTISTLPVAYSDKSFCADIHISSNGKFVYASNRGHNSIAIFKVNEQNGSLSLLGHESTKGDWPRNFSLSADEKFLLVANQRSNNIVSFSRNKDSGLLEFVDEIEAPSPVCILF